MLPQSQYEVSEQGGHATEQEVPAINSIFLEEEQSEHDATQTGGKPTQYLKFIAPQQQQEIKLEEDGSPLSNRNRAESPLHSSSYESAPSSQSKLHNCPKHLVKVLSEALELRRLHTKQYLAELPEMKEDELKAFKSLLDLIWMSHKRKLKSVSKELLKIVFETGSEKMNRLRLLHNPIIRNCFNGLNEQATDYAKQILREYTFQRLVERRKQLVQDSRLVQKDVIMKYIELFMKQLKSGVIKERMSKSDTLKVTDEQYNENLL